MGPEEDLPTLLSRKDHLGVLHYLRSHQLREPDIVIEHAFALFGGPELSKAKPKPPNPILSLILPSSGLDEAECLAALEQLCLAAIDVQNHTLADRCLNIIRVSVSKESTRFRRLLALCLESAGDIEGAGNVYDALLKENPSNGFALKRKYCMLRSQPGKEAEASTALNDYIERNMGDTSAWNEMATLCMDMGDYKGAAYCYEEVVVGSPLSDAVHCKMGEIYATAGGLDNLKLARKHMAQSLELNPGNLRALYGLLASACAFLDEMEAAGKNKKEAEEMEGDISRELVKYGAEKLMKCYKGTKMASVVNKFLEAQKGE